MKSIYGNDLTLTMKILQRNDNFSSIKPTSIGNIGKNLNLALSNILKGESFDKKKSLRISRMKRSFGQQVPSQVLKYLFLVVKFDREFKCFNHSKNEINIKGGLKDSLSLHLPTLVHK